jgi:hypothetical protein
MPEPTRSRRWRPWLRALHRDLGYLAVGLTFVYALSGLAVNHIADWDPNFDNYERELRVATPLPAEDAAAAAYVLKELSLEAVRRATCTAWTRRSCRSSSRRRRCTCARTPARCARRASGRACC